MEITNKLTAEIIEYIEDRYAAGPEFLWMKFPKDAAFRHRENSKWFAALMLDTPKEKLGLKEQGSVDILVLKCEPLMADILVKSGRFLPGYHMNKKHWITVFLDGSVGVEEICSLIDKSYELTRK